MVAVGLVVSLTPTSQVVLRILIIVLLSLTSVINFVIHVLNWLPIHVVELLGTLEQTLVHCVVVNQLDVLLLVDGYAVPHQVGLVSLNYAHFFVFETCWLVFVATVDVIRIFFFFILIDLIVTNFVLLMLFLLLLLLIMILNVVNLIEIGLKDTTSVFSTTITLEFIASILNELL